MGCDIHLYVEKWENGAWKSADKWRRSDWASEGDERYDELVVNYPDRFYQGRNYDLFAILANVRNGEGFAGVVTGRGYNPISMPRGLPEDVCAEVKKDSDNWGIDGHSHSWLLVQELLDYDWTQTTKRFGVLNLEEFIDWSRWDRRMGNWPNSFSGDVFGPELRIVDMDEGDALIVKYDLFKQREVPKAKELDGVYVRCQWDTPYYKGVRHFWGETIPRLLHLGDPKNVRIVFWFDN